MSFGPAIGLQRSESLATHPGVLSLAEVPQDDSDAALRVEMKLAVPGADAEEIRGMLESNCRRIVYNEPVSQVNSIYFDDCFLSGAREPLGGTDRRTKLRLRWYDSPTPGRRVFLEVKRRMNRVIGKERLAIESASPVGDLTYEELRDELCAILPSRFREVLMLRPEPALINSYSREHFAVEGASIRLTLDTNIVCYDQSGLLRPRLRFGVPLRHLVVIEGKAPCGSEAELRQVMHRLRLRVTSSLGAATGTKLDDA